MPAYWIARSNILDPEEYSKYSAQVPGIVKKHGGITRARGGQYKTVEGPDVFKRFIVIEFPSYEAALQCFESDEYRAAAAFRRGDAGQVEITIVDGLEPVK